MPNQYLSPDRKSVAKLPDPENGANDCHALIKYLNGLGYEPKCEWRKSRNGAFVEIRRGEYYDAWQGKNWMHGVCELALKVIE